MFKLTALECGAGSHYSTSVSGCPASCAEPLSQGSCTEPTRSGCACDRGRFLDGQECVLFQHCGCVYMGRYFSVSIGVLLSLVER